MSTPAANEKSPPKEPLHPHAMRQLFTDRARAFYAQAELFDLCREMGQRPIVLDSADVRRDPERMLRRLCTALQIPFDPAMLSWPAGPRAEDGIWAAHWYGAVHRSTGFAGAEGPPPRVDHALLPLLEQALPHYEFLAARALQS